MVAKPYEPPAIVTTERVQYCELDGKCATLFAVKGGPPLLTLDLNPRFPFRRELRRLETHGW